MWPDDKEVHQRSPESGPSHGRPSSSSDVMIFDERKLPAAAMSPMPTVTSLNAYKSKVHLGTKIELHDGEIVKDLSCPQYVWNSIRSTSRAERLICAIALLALVVCGGLVIYFVQTKDSPEKDVDVAPHEWNISRTMWLAQPYNNSEIEFKTPLKLVVIQHTVGNQCHRFTKCAAELRNLQNYFLKHNKYDIPYNFFIGNDGRVYEGRGWNREGAHTLGYNKCSVGIGFIGDYREEIISHATVTDAQQKRCLEILDEGVQLGYLDPNYLVVGAMDVSKTVSPGSNLYNAIRKWPHYDHENRYKGLNCTLIQQEDRQANKDKI